MAGSEIAGEAARGFATADLPPAELACTGWAVPAIVEVKQYLDAHPKAILAGLEHLDERYVKAVGYATKAKSRGRRRTALHA